MKLDWTRSQPMVKYRTKLSDHLPVYVNQLMRLHNYKLLKEYRLLRHRLMKKSASINTNQANTLVQKVASSSVFTNGPEHFKDCAENSKYSYQSPPITFIMRKTAFGSSSYELVIRIGYIELLANSGFIGSDNSDMLLPFLGLAMKNLPPAVTGGVNTQSSTLIFVNDVQEACNTQPRIIKRYLYSLENAPRSTKLKGELTLIRTYLSTIVSSRRGEPLVFKHLGYD